MKTLDAKHVLEDFAACLRGHRERFVDCLTDKDMTELIQALEEFAIPLIEIRVQEIELSRQRLPSMYRKD